MTPPFIFAFGKFNGPAVDGLATNAFVFGGNIGSSTGTSTVENYVFATGTKATAPAAMSLTPSSDGVSFPAMAMPPAPRPDTTSVECDPDAPLDQARHAMLQIDIGEPQDICVICRLLSPPVVGESPKARLYGEARKSSIPDAPIRRAFAAMEWSRIITV